MPRRPADPDARQRWRTFLANHREAIAAIDFFTVPTATFRVLYIFFIVHHARRVLLHFRVTGHPTAAWITQQLREAFPYDQAPRYLILDRDAKYGNEVITAIRAHGHRTKADHGAQSLAERSRREVRRHRTPRSPRPRHRPQRETPPAPSGLLRLASRGMTVPLDKSIDAVSSWGSCAFAEGKPPPSLSADGHDSRRHTQGAFGRPDCLPTQAA